MARFLNNLKIVFYFGGLIKENQAPHEDKLKLREVSGEIIRS